MKRPDARFVENINEKCRPSTVANQYNQLESQQWVDAKEALEEAGFEDEEEATRFLADLLMVMCCGIVHLLACNLGSCVREYMYYTVCAQRAYILTNKHTHKKTHVNKKFRVMFLIFFFA